MEDDSGSFQPVQHNDFFSDLGGGMRLSKKQVNIRNEILENSKYIHQKSLGEKLQKYIRPKASSQLLQQEPRQTTLPVKRHDLNRTSFEDLKLIKPLLKAVSQLEYAYPTPIQCLTIPAILSGKDVLASSITGSGKTAAFLIPIMQRFYNCEQANYSRVLILTPTRQLAIQCYQNFTSLNKYVHLEACLAIGASSIQKQQTQLRNHPEFVIATPGRILDLLTNSQSFGLEYLQVLVFDEADKLLQMGFEAEIKQILTYLNQDVQTILFSATLGKEVNKLATLAMRKPIRLSADPDNSTAQKLHQQIYKLPRDDQTLREAALYTILTKIYTKKVIVFFKTKQECHRMAVVMTLSGWPACELHGNLSQTQRIQAFNHFKEGKFQYMMATDLAARGLDVKEVQTVVNYQLPTELTRYIHRVGRTARAGCVGSCITLCVDTECLKLKKMMKSTGDKLFKLNVDEVLIKQSHRHIQGLQKDIQQIMEEEREERSIRKAEMELQKLQNIHQHRDEIYNKPKKTWFLSNQEKKQIKKTSRAEALGEELLPQKQKQAKRRKPIKKDKPRLSKPNKKRFKGRV